MNWRYILIIFILTVIAAGSVFWITKIPQKKFGGKPTTSSLLSEFVETIFRAYKSPMGGGILPEPPRALIKKTEVFLKEMIKSEIKVTYTFTDHLAESSSPHSLVVYTAPNPFRWRVDFIMNLKSGEYKNIYLYDGSVYSTCSSGGNAPLGCYRASETFLENELQTPLPLTEFLNDILDPLTLKKLVPEVKAKQAQIQKDTRIIAAYSADCQIVDDEYSILDFCFAKDANLLLHLDVKRKTSSGNILRHFTLTAQSVDFSPFPKEVFILP